MPLSLEQITKTKRFKSDKLRSLINILYTSYWINDQWKDIFKRFDISHPQYNVLRILRGQNGKPLNLKDVHVRMLERNSNTTRLVEKLRLKGFVHRQQCADNRRMVEITITDKGMEVLNELEPILFRQQETIFANMTRDDANQINDLLNQLRG